MTYNVFGGTLNLAQLNSYLQVKRSSSYVKDIGIAYQLVSDTVMCYQPVFVGGLPSIERQSC